MVITIALTTIGNPDQVHVSVEYSVTSDILLFNRIPEYPCPNLQKSQEGLFKGCNGFHVIQVALLGTRASYVRPTSASLRKHCVLGKVAGRPEVTAHPRLIHLHSALLAGCCHQADCKRTCSAPRRVCWAAVSSLVDGDLVWFNDITRGPQPLTQAAE